MKSYFKLMFKTQTEMEAIAVSQAHNAYCDESADA